MYIWRLDPISGIKYCFSYDTAISNTWSSDSQTLIPDFLGQNYLEFGILKAMPVIKLMHSKLLETVL